MKNNKVRFGVDLKEKVVGVLYMKKDDFIDMCKRMVAEYNNRYKSVNGNVTCISTDDVDVINYYNTQYIKQAVLSTPFISDEIFVVSLDQKTKKMDSYCIKINEIPNLLIKGGRSK
jgi:hypothetical protein